MIRGLLNLLTLLSLLLCVAAVFSLVRLHRFRAYAEGPTGQSVRELGVCEVFRKGSTDLDELVRVVDRHLRPPAPENSPN